MKAFCSANIAGRQGTVPTTMDKEKRLKALQNQIHRFQRRLEKLEQISDRYSWIRLVVFAAGIIVTTAVFFLLEPWLISITLILTAISFATVVHLHGQVDLAITRCKIWLNIKTEQIARLRLDWEHIPPSTLQPQNSLEADLDLAGEYSLHRLLNTAVLRGGSQRLREWLATAIPEPQQTLQRQRLARELAPLWLFRGRLILSGRMAARFGEGWSEEILLSWLESHTLSSSLRGWLWLLGVLAALNIILFTLNVIGIAPPLWQATFLLYVTLFLVRSRETGEPFRESATMRDSLEQLVAVFGRLETFSYRDTPHLKILCTPFLDPDQRPSQHLSSIKRVVAATGIRGNPVLWLILNAVVPWDYYFAYRLDKLKTKLARYLPSWLDVWFELEALSSLANLAYLNPGYCFPDFIADADQNRAAMFQASGLGHPLIPDDEKICNDFAIEAAGEITIFTGSNMSGKSTFLRTVGVNLILANAGGPVNARQLRTRHLRLYTCIRISDSVTNGVSYFYAEVKCLKGLLEELGREHPLPLFYFIDEIFRGTNNRERLAGSRAYIQALAGATGIGLISTHDLELVHLADEIPAIKNYHFTDDVVDGRMVFDYQLHFGPSPTTNALKIMRMEGLPV